MTLDFRILGPFEVFRDGLPVQLGGPRQRAVLAALVVECNRVVSSDRLADEIWAGHPQSGTKATLHAYVSKLRRALEPERAPGGPHGVLVTEPPGYVLRVDPEQVDASRFEALAEAGRAALATGDPERGAALLNAALSLWRGPALADFASEVFAAPHAARLEELRLAATEDHIEAALALGRHRAIVGDLEALIRAHSFRERLWGQLMVALYRSGHRTEALRAYEDARSVLGEGLGIEPSPALRALEKAVAAGDPALDWRPSAPATPARAPTALDVGSPTFLGRDGEFALLHRRLGEALAGRGRLVLVTGEAGIGKTRLLEEMAATARSAEAEVAWGRGSQAEGAPAFSPWVQMVRALVAGADPVLVRHALGAGVAEVAQIAPELKELAPGLEAPPAVPPDMARFRLYDAMARFFARLAARRPLVLLLDDLHLADVASLDLLGFLGPQLPTAPILLVATYRDLEVDPAHPLVRTVAKLGYEPAVSRLALAGLASAEVARFVAQMTGVDPSPALVGALHERTEGNPLFLGELLRLLQAEDRLSPAGALAAAVPDEVRAVIARRLAHLPRATLQLLELAAVAGRDFDLELVREAEGLTPERALERLEAAFVTRILAEDPVYPGRYRFGHTLIRDILYTGLSPRRRTRLHHRLGQALERIHGPGDGPHLVQLTHHFFHAAPPGPADVAFGYAVRAAGWAMAHLAYEQAQEELRRALQLLRVMPFCLERVQRELELQLRLGLLAQMTEGYAAPATGEAYARALELCQQLRHVPESLPSLELLAALFQLSSFFCVRCDFAASQELAEEMIAIGQGSDDPMFSWAGHLAMGAIACQTGHPGDGRHHLERAMELSPALDEPTAAAVFVHHPGVISRGNLAVPLWLVGDGRAREVTSEAVNLARRIHDDSSLAFALFFAAFVAVLDGDPARARRWADEGVALCADRGFRLLGAVLAVFRGWAKSEQGDPEAGAAEVAGGIAAFDATGARMNRTFLLGLLAQARRRAGRVEEGLETLEEALAAVEATGECGYEAELHRLRGEFLLAAFPGSVDEARAAFNRAMAVAEAQGATALAERARAGLPRSG